jgi:glutathione synthase/RimK-type ligase-like ATP-grasp enzyme
MHASDEDWQGAFQAACQTLGLESRVIAVRRSDWLRQTDGLDAFIWRPNMGEASTMAELRSKLPLLEAKGIRCFPNSLMLWLYDDKIRETYFLARHGYPMPETFVTFDEDEARQYARTAKYPLVAKTHMGAAASGVMILESPQTAERLLNRVFAPQPVWDKVLVKFYFEPRLARGNFLAARHYRFRDVCPRYAYFQEFVPGTGDWRVTRFGPNVVSVFVRRNRPGDFRASGGGLFQELTEEELPTEACELALKISNRHGFTSMAYDFMRKPAGWVIGEISYTFALNPIYSRTLFRRVDGTYRKVAPIPICEMHLQAMCEASRDRNAAAGLGWVLPELRRSGPPDWPEPETKRHATQNEKHEIPAAI